MVSSMEYYWKMMVVAVTELMPKRMEEDAYQETVCVVGKKSRRAILSNLENLKLTEKVGKGMQRKGSPGCQGKCPLWGEREHPCVAFTGEVNVAVAGNQNMY